jgi:hypothetical protein
MQENGFIKPLVNAVAGPLATRLFVMILVASLGTFVYNVNSFMIYYQIHVDNHIEKVNFFQTMCRDDTVARLSGQTIQCAEARRLRDQWPVWHALADLATDWLPCGREGCYYYVREWTNSFLVKIVLLFGIGYALFMLIWGLSIARYRRYAESTKFKLPSEGLETEVLRRNKID